MLKVLILLTLVMGTFVASAQVDTEFWFVAPELSHRGNTGGTPGTLRIATMELEATVTISMPANPAFADIVLNIPANGTRAVDLSYLIDIAGFDNTGLENRPLTVSGINNYGLHITSTNMITAYWEVNYERGSDLWTLKGSNGEGTLFYTPFQTDYDNRGGITPRAYSAIDIVSTADNNQVTITMPSTAAGAYGSAVTTIPAGGTHTLTLNEGETFSVYPDNFSVLAADRLAGAKIESTDSIAVTLKDDGLLTGAQDLVGDQIVPVDIIGDNYIVPEMANPNYIYVLATEDNTEVFAYDAAGVTLTWAGGTPSVTLNEGEQARLQVPNGAKFANITSRSNPLDPAKPIYVFQLAIENASRGGALVPPIGCTGNTQLAFTRARADKFYFYVITEKGHEDNFVIDGDTAQSLISDKLIDWTEIGTTGWMAYMTSSLPASQLSVGQHLVENTEGIFHLAIVNGFPSGPHGRLYYGYYSDFGGLNIGANVAGTNSSIVRACFGDSVQLYAFGGTNYQWTPDTYLDDATLNLPTAINLPPGQHKYEVLVSGGCGSGVLPLTIDVSSKVEAYLTSDVASGCSPLEVNIVDKSTGAFSWQYDFGGGAPLVNYDYDIETSAPPPPDTITFIENYTNTTDTIRYDTVTLLVKNSSGCADIMSKTFVTFPEISSGFSVDADSGCHPLEVQFNNTSSGNTDTWIWDFDDGGSSIEPDPDHEFQNLLGPDSYLFNTRLIAISPYLCRDTSYYEVKVKPYIEAKFAYDTSVACSPHEIVISDQSIGADSYHWDFGDLTFSTSSGPQITKLYDNNTGVIQTYTITLTVENEEGCTDQFQRQVTIYPEVVSGFTPTPDEVCSPGEVVFSNTSTGAATYLWDFGDGGSSTKPHGIHLYDRNLTGQDTTFTAMLVATSTELCRDTFTHDILVHPFIEAAYTVENVVGCDPFAVTINNESVGADQYIWDFGDGTPTSNTSDPVFVHVFENNTGAKAEYDFELLVSNTEGCTDSMQRKITVHPEITSNWSADKFSGCHPLEVTFTDLSVNAINYLWDFGDGAASTDETPNHTFTNFGTTDTTYIVSLTTSTADGVCVKTTPFPITVSPQVTSEFTFANAKGCVPFEVEFENLSINGDQFTWDFGDGTPVINTSDPGPQVHTFNNNDFSSTTDYTVSLTVENAQGCVKVSTKTVSVYPDIDAEFRVSADSGCQPLEVQFTDESQGAGSFIWDFGDGSTSNLQNPLHNFINNTSSDTTYRVKLITIAPNNICRDSSFMDIKVNAFVNADFVLQDDLGCTPFNVVIENSSMNGAEYHWDFGDSEIQTTFNNDPVTHQFVNADFTLQQDFEITLVAESAAGCTSQRKRTLTVEPDILADFTVDTQEDCHPLTVNFTNASSGEAYYHWDFGNGTTSLQENPTQVFHNIGLTDTTYQVWLRVTAANNECVDSMMMEITVNPYVKADFTFQDNSNCTPSAVQLQNSSVGGDNFTWDFGDGSDTTTNDLSPVTHTFVNADYNAIASYDVVLTAHNDEGCSHQVTKVVEVYPDILADFTPTVTEGCHPLTVDFNNESLGGFSYDWDFDDGASSNKISPDHRFNNYTDSVITRQVRLIATSRFNCTHEMTVDITIHPKPLARFDTDILIDCPPFEVPLTNTSLNADVYNWNFGDGVRTTVNNTDPVSHTYDNLTPDIQDYLVKLVASSDFGCADSSQQRIYVYPRTTADFSVNNEGCSPLAASFLNTSVRGNTYLWDFGDGSFMSSTNPTNVYFNFGGEDTTYLVSLTSTSKNGCVDTRVDTIQVYAQPDAEFVVNPTHQEFPSSTVSLQNLTPEGIWSYHWDMDDGNTRDLRSPADYTYSTWGEYEIKLNVQTDHCGDSVSHKIRIFPASPVADFDTVYGECAPLEVKFVNNSLYGEDYLWEFDDGTSSTDFEPFHVFDEAGIYNVKLTVTGEGGIDYDYSLVEVYQVPIASFTMAPDTVMLPNQVTRFFNSSQYGEFYNWDFGDGHSSSEENTTHLYEEVGVYDVTLDVWTEKGCAEQFVKSAGAVVLGEGDLAFPTAFKPSRSGPSGGNYDQTQAERNEIFHPAWIGVQNYKLEIYNRWGEKLFESNDINLGWDGYSKGKLVEQGVYIWKVTGTYNNGLPFSMAGDVTLLHRPE